MRVTCASDSAVTGETNLSVVLAGLDPLPHDGEYVFVTLPDRRLPTGVDPGAHLR